MAERDTTRGRSPALPLGAGALLGGLFGLALGFGELREGLGQVLNQNWLAQGMWRLTAEALWSPLITFCWGTVAGALLGLIASPFAPRAPLPALLNRSILVVGLVALTGALFLGAGLLLADRGTTDRPHVLWIVIDALRADRMGCYGNERDTSPFLDNLAVEGIRFERAISQESYTMASVASYFTSTYPHVNGVMYDKPLIDTLGESYLTVAEVFRNAGYRTAAFVFNPHLQRQFNFAQGFDVYDDRGPHQEEGLDENTLIYEYWETVERMLDRVGAFLEGPEKPDPGQPIFLYLHYRDVHGPLVPPPDYSTMFLPDMFDEKASQRVRDRVTQTVGKVETDPMLEDSLMFVETQYDASLRYTDDGIERMFALLAEHGIDTSDAVIAVTADHGEELNDAHPADRPGFGHGRTVYIEQIHVPLILRLPDAELANRLVAAPVELLDLGPTLLDAVGMPGSDGGAFQGRSLLPLVGSEPGGPRPVFSGGNHGRGVVLYDGFAFYSYETMTKERMRYYAERPPEDYPYSRGSQLFDMEADAAQTIDLEAARGERAKELEERFLLPWLLRGTGKASGAAELDEDTKDHLRDLGYIEE